jgi:RNA polymerase sigma-70 factor (ECF subfamily)
MTGERNIPPLGNGWEEASSGRAEGVERPNIEDIEGIYRQYSKRVYSLCLHMTGNTSEAQDLTQEAFLHLFRKLDTFRGDSTFYTWFYRLAVNVVLMQFRRKRQLMETSLEEMMEADDRGRAAHRDVAVPRTRRHSSIDIICLRQAVEQLPLGFRLVFVLHEIEGFEHREIAEMLACSVSTSKSQLHRARLRLREVLAQGPCQQASAKQLRPRDLLSGTPSIAAEALG